MKIRHSSTRASSATVIILLAVAGIYLPGCSTTAEKKKEETKTAAVSTIPVDGKVLQFDSLREQMQISGTLSARQEVNIMSELSRKIITVYAEEGREVAAGALLFKLDDADLLAQLEQYEQQEHLALLNERRLKDLIDHQAALQQDYDQAFTNLKVIRAQITQLKVMIGKTYLRAPFSGRIGLVNVHKGALVTPGQPLANLEDNSSIKVDFYIPEKYSRQFETGQTVTFHVESSPKSYQAHITAQESRLNSDSRNLLIRAVATNKEQDLIPGQSARITVDLNSAANALLVPGNVLLPSAQGYSIYIARNGKAQLQSVQTGERNADNIHVTTGLQPGDTIITSNILRLSPGAALQFISVH
ncbi:efflux RND transporter periplasmic adaptor subunit [Chitinophaga filiformis]|uniref:efflux RND transporter periplasmic adaptor subunit n=1 Tax=Chitinophaga filiformis TaxID=104663 RepID=UPI001F3271CE|nr:efflux RND transporter periplasmic adaptor subunit [Chitinophaga filiformis]MCF6406411.1 efflux RND transporter periplasmic adaptor subunit [Chitinophaga filiformis]